MSNKSKPGNDLNRKRITNIKIKDRILTYIILSQAPEPQELNIMEVILKIILLVIIAKAKAIASILPIFCISFILRLLSFSICAFPKFPFPAYTALFHRSFSI